MTLRRDRAVWIAALAAALLHMVPYWHAAAVAEPGWTFTGTIHSSPDFVQYRSWPRQSMAEGPIVTDRFTSEANAKHLPVFFYWGIGVASRVSGVSPEWVFAYSGAVFAGLLTVLIVGLVRTFVPTRNHAWWIVGAIMLGGGMGAHAKLAKAVATLSGGGAALVADAEARISGGGVTWMWFEDYRGHYVFSTLFDTHFLLIWSATLAAVLTYWLALKSESARSVSVAALAFAFATIIHVYEGVTLLAIVACVTLLWWVKRLPMRRPLVIAFTLTVTVGVCLLGLVALQRGSGLPIPGWRALTIPLTILVLAYPLAWALIAWGGMDSWRNAASQEVFLWGWLLGCVGVTLSGPFYPYPDRGTMTLQVVITLIAGLIWFARRDRVTPAVAMVAVAFMGLTPAMEVVKVWRMSDFTTSEPHKFVDGQHASAIEILESRATPQDLLVVEEDDVLWLAPRYPGRFYCGHFFLTIDFGRKCGEVAERLETGGPTLAAFLDEHEARFVFTGRPDAVRTLSTAPGVQLLAQTSSGALFEVRATR